MEKNGGDGKFQMTLIGLPQNVLILCFRDLLLTTLQNYPSSTSWSLFVYYVICVRSEKEMLAKITLQNHLLCKKPNQDPPEKKSSLGRFLQMRALFDKAKPNWAIVTKLQHTSDISLGKYRNLHLVAMYQCLTLQQASISTTHFPANEAASAIRNQSVQQLASQE